VTSDDISRRHSAGMRHGHRRGPHRAARVAGGYALDGVKGIRDPGHGGGGSSA